jgi:hypothetical protein
MLRSRRILGFALFLAVALLPVRDGAAQTTQKTAVPAAHKPSHRSKKPAPAAEVPEEPAAPPTLEQQPPAPPQVTYTGGQLTISSTNATLSQVLQSVQRQTGAIVDIPPGAGNERVVATLGPGKPQNVLASLLNGSKFNYVILGEPNNPGAVQKVILMAKVAGSSSPSPNTSAQSSFRSPPLPSQAQVVETPEDEYQPSEPEVENQNPPPGQSDMSNSAPLSPDAVQPGNRTPEQMLQELQRMQQQQQLMQQQLNPANRQNFGQPIVPQNPQPGTPFPSQAVNPQPE